MEGVILGWEAPGGAHKAIFCTTIENYMVYSSQSSRKPLALVETRISGMLQLERKLGARGGEPRNWGESRERGRRERGRVGPGVVPLF